MADLPDDGCVVHITGTDEDCELCVADLEALTAEYRKVISSNIELERGLQRQGAQMTPASALAIRLDTFIRMVVPDPKAYLRLDIAFARNYNQALMNASQEVMRAKLLTPR